MIYKSYTAFPAHMGWYISVSYTHLDVYKRQDRDIPSIKADLPLTLAPWITGMAIRRMEDGCMPIVQTTALLFAIRQVRKA